MVDPAEIERRRAGIVEHGRAGRPRVARSVASRHRPRREHLDRPPPLAPAGRTLAGDHVCRNETGRGGAADDSGIKWLDGLDLVWVPDDGPLGWIVGSAVVIVLVVVFFTVVLPVLVPVVGVVLVLVLAALGVGLRVLLHRPWRVSARSARGSGAGGSSGGTRSHKAIDAVADALASGNRLEAVDPTRALGARKS